MGLLSKVKAVLKNRNYSESSNSSGYETVYPDEVAEVDNSSVASSKSSNSSGYETVYPDEVAEVDNSSVASIESSNSSGYETVYPDTTLKDVPALVERIPQKEVAQSAEIDKSFGLLEGDVSSFSSKESDASQSDIAAPVDQDKPKLNEQSKPLPYKPVTEEELNAEEITSTQQENFELQQENFELFKQNNDIYEQNLDLDRKGKKVNQESLDQIQENSAIIQKNNEAIIKNDDELGDNPRFTQQDKELLDIKLKETSDKYQEIEQAYNKEFPHLKDDESWIKERPSPAQQAENELRGKTKIEVEAETKEGYSRNKTANELQDLKDQVDIKAKVAEIESKLQGKSIEQQPDNTKDAELAGSPVTDEVSSNSSVKQTPDAEPKVAAKIEKQQNKELAL